MKELIIFATGYMVGIATSLALFRYGMNYATRFIYKIKADVPLEEIGTPLEQEFTGDNHE
jgi:hypothetical protein